LEATFEREKRKWFLPLDPPTTRCTLLKSNLGIGHWKRKIRVGTLLDEFPMAYFSLPMTNSENRNKGRQRSMQMGIWKSKLCGSD
jgi:hypothetical protein